MGESIVTEDMSAAGDEGEGFSLTRRQVIAGTIVGGGLMWAAPTLLSSPAAWATHCPCGGIKATFKLPSNPESSVNCGVQCLSHRDEFNFPCPDDLLNCLIAEGFITQEPIPQPFDHGQIRKARITLTGGITVLAVGAKSDSECYFADCTNSYCPNTCEQQAGVGCGGADGVPPNRIVICPGGSTVHSSCTNDTSVTTGLPAAPGCQTPQAGRTEIIVDTIGDPINPIELAICIPNALTGICPA